MVGQPAWEQERPVSAPAVRPLGCQPRGGLGAASRISRETAKARSAERESEEVIVALKAWTTEPAGATGLYLSRAFDGGGAA